MARVMTPAGRARYQSTRRRAGFYSGQVTDLCHTFNWMARRAHRELAFIIKYSPPRKRSK